jgi:hypothetical protein
LRAALDPHTAERNISFFRENPFSPIADFGHLEYTHHNQNQLEVGA